MDGVVPGAVTWGCVPTHGLCARARSKVIVKHENHPLVVEATLVSNLGPISSLLIIMRAINGILFGVVGRLIYYICDIVHRQLPLLLDMEVRVLRLLLLPDKWYQRVHMPVVHKAELLLVCLGIALNAEV